MTLVRFFKFAGLFCFGTIILSTSAHAQQVPLKIAIVDFQKILTTASAPKSVNDQIQNIRENYRKEVQKDETDLRNSNQELAQKQTLLSADAFNAERRKFEQKVLEVQKSVQQKNQNLQIAQNQAKQKIMQELRTIILNISKEKNYSLVLRREQTVIVADDFDITDQVITELNKKLPKITISEK